MPPVRRIALLVLGAVAFGVLAGLFKGDDPGLRGGIGNLSAPWLLVGFLPALGCRRLLAGALVGLACTVAALGGFYATLTVVLHGHLHGGGYLSELSVELGANRVYLVGGIVSGLLAGLAGAWVGRRHREAVWLLVGALLAGEVVVVALVQGRQLLRAPLRFQWGVGDWRPYLGEALAGAVVLVVVTLSVLRRRGAVRSARRLRA